MNTNLAIEILKQATLETTVGACEKCPRKDKNKSCIGCLDDAKEKVLDNLQQKETIIKEVRDYIDKHCVNEKVSKEVGFKCYTMADTNELEHIIKLLDKENKQ